MCIMLCKIFEKIGVKKNKYLINLNNRKILNGILETVGITDSNNYDATLGTSEKVLRSIDKIDRLGFDGVKDLLGKGRRDESGDFTNGANLTNEQIDTIMQFIKLESGDNIVTLNQLKNLVSNSLIGKQGINELEEILEYCELAGLFEDRIRINSGIVRGLDIIRTVFEAELTDKIIGNKGKITEIGSVAGGGRYDDLVKDLQKMVPATGFSTVLIVCYLH